MAVDKSHDVALFTSATPYPASLNDADTIWHLVFSTPPSDPNTPLYIDAATDESFSWRDFRELTKRLGLALRKSGLQPGQCVCIFAPNSPEFALLFWSAQVAGLLVTFANPAYVPDELNHVLRDSSVAAVFVDSDSERVGRQSAQESGVKPDRVIHLQKGHRNSIWDMLDACGGQQLEPPHISPQDAIRTTALRCYSSGTTGKPKGVNLTHHNCHHALYQQAITQTELYARDVGHRYLAYMPLYHIAGIGVYLFHNVKLGIPTVVMRSFNFDTFLHLVQKHRITLCHLVPPIALQIAKSEKVQEYDLKSLRFVTCGAAALGRELHEAVERRLGVVCVSSFGMTEVCGPAFIDRVETRQFGGSGKLLAGIEGRIVDGEVQLRGPNMTIGYHNNPKADQEFFAGDGWCRTGDIGRVDAAGNLYITDRKKELIKCKGFQVAPAELEDLLISHPDVEKAGVVAEPRPEEAGEAPRAFIVLKDPSKASPALASDIIQFMATRTAHFKKIRGGVTFIEEMPTTPSGKILRRILQSRLGEPAFGSERRESRL